VTGHADRPARAAAPVPLVYSVEEAAGVLGIGRTFMFRLVATGQVESFKIGSRRKITRHALDTYIARQLARQASSRSRT
jgi:excisionase family DNA binding protein